MLVRSLPPSHSLLARAALVPPRLRHSPHPLASHARTHATAVSVNGFSQLKPTRYGQPLPKSHPHLIRDHETTPGIKQSEYDRRRRELMKGLPDGSVVVCVAGQVKYMSGQIFYKFRQSSDFWYLTGFDEPDAALVLEKRPSSPRGYYMYIFSTGTDPMKEKWDGAKTAPDDVIKFFGADEAEPIAALPCVLKSVTAIASAVYIDVPNHSKRSRAVSPKTLLKYLTPGSMSRTEYDSILDSLSASKRKPLAPEIGRLRAVKSEAEQAVMRQAADISANAHNKTMRFTEPGISEHAVAAHFEYLCAREGSQRPAYVPVVASGPNALIIHYTSNNQLIADHEMVLIDAGCEYNGYASDITRTFPANGKFTPEQAALYTAVLEVQKHLITLCTEEADMSIMHLHRESSSKLRRELDRIGFNFPLGSGSLDTLYPHLVGHPVGIDLHESSLTNTNAPVKAGMVITIEPGVYVPPLPEFPKHFHNIGIRIEDEVVVGKKRPVVLSVNAPKEIADIEGSCQGALGLMPF
ncbi:peptidase M24, structural domain-containing protein [Epithele typhae]|uniref:peptidase M24, structural domain-containing protein n=1 Tax=Epithele typhae TaxID=378194 RepID=UPI002007E200|nr:peptidase M24, structural domain-containing protein [Epithele typhae]KAH9921540.1 peptidase M24, structural domain-containing protein [Epithele typhae]